MIVNRTLKHIHVHVPKTGGESLLFILQQHKDWVNDFGQHAILTDIKNKDIELYNNSKDYFKTICIRNPWEHAVSFYYHAMDKSRFYIENFFSYSNFHDLSNDEKIKIDTSFNNFIKSSYHKYCQSNYTKECEIKFDKWFNYDDWGLMLEFFEKKYDIKLINSFRKHNKFDIDFVKPIKINDDYRTFYDDETYQFVKDLSENEINKFNYKFDK